MKKKSGLLGKSTSKAEVSGITARGVWLIAGGVEYFAPFSDFPWFRSAKVSSVYMVEEPHPGHLFWPELDVDLHIDSLKSPEMYPLIAKDKAKGKSKRSA